jgi:hypothetical protein
MTDFGGGAQPTPSTTMASGGQPAAAPAAPPPPPPSGFSDRFSAAYGGAPPAPGRTPLRATVGPRPLESGPQTAQAPSGAPSTDDIQRYETRGNNKLQAATHYAVDSQQATALRDAGNKDLEIAKQLREQRAKYFEPTPEQKNVTSGAEERKGQIAADTKYYDSLHRGLVGSGMIAAQQKQNIDMLRQVANSPSFTPGTGSSAALWLQRAGARLGINPQSAAPREIFNQVSARILADQFSGMKSMASETGETGARIFKPMLDIEEKANITPEDSLEGIKSKLDLIDKTGDLMMRWANKADDYKQAHGWLDAAFDKDLRGDIASWHVVNATSGGGALIAPQAPPLHTQKQFEDWAQSKGLKSGDPLILSNGRLKTVP